MAYRAGIHKGIKVEFHALTPINNDMLDDLTNEFKKRIEEEYQIAYSKSEIWRIS